MNKYYIRFNPEALHVPNSKVTWIVLEISDTATTRFVAESVSIEVKSFTEKSLEDRNWWNIACYGYMIRENHQVRIVESV